jgi:probable rRNA maturation factor
MATDPDERSLTVVVTDGRGRSVKAPGLAAWLRQAAPARARGEVTIALVSDARMRTLNRTYRGKDYATDVLSFQADARRKARRPHGPAGGAGAEQCLGDIVIATGVARRQARDLGHSVAVELRILALHGLLHLLGYDHERDRGRMRTVEQRLLRRSGVRDGLIERAHA